MIETLEYIDLYFTGNLSASEKAAFESRCETDTAFAEDVAFYISARSELRNNLYEEKRKEFKELYARLSAETQTQSRGILRKLYPFLAAAAAACLILFIGWQFFFKDNLSTHQPAQLANQYIEQRIQNPEVPMGSDDKDSLDSGIAAFKKKNYREAEKILSVLSSQKNNNSEAIKYLGFLYLVNRDYDKAILQFQRLAQTDLYANPGLFYQAVTLMKRSANGDVAKAKLLLKEVVAKGLPGNVEAGQWLNDM